MSTQSENDLPLYDPDEQTTYSLEIIAQITGISMQTILHYQEHGLLSQAETATAFDDQTLRTLRRIEHLREISDANLSGLKLLLTLMDEVERLKISLRERK